MKTINSRQNPHIKAIVALKRARDRRTQGKFLAEGLRVCTALIKAGWEPIGLYTVESLVKMALKLAPEEQITLMTMEVMAKMSQASTPSGMVGVFKLPKKPKIEKLSSGIVLAEVSDPGNMGTLIRTCAAMGHTSVVVVGGTDPWSHKVVQASAGTIANVNIFSWSWNKLLENKNDKKLIALVVRDGQEPEKIDLKNSLLVIGNEVRGIAQEWINSCDKKMTLSMPGKVESLNAAVAGAIGLYLATNPKT